MAFSADAIANYFLDKAEAEGRELTHMQIQKLVFFAHAWHLALTGRPLIREDVEVWEYGPVIRSLYSEFAEFGKHPINRRAVELTWERDETGRISTREVTPSIENDISGETSLSNIVVLLDRIWQLYGGMTAIQLSNLTHRKGEPWMVVRESIPGQLPRNLHLPNSLIEEVYRGYLNSPPS